MNLLALASEDVGENPRTVVRVRTSVWGDRRGIHMTRSVTFLRKRCRGHLLLEDDVQNIGAQETLASIEDFATRPDGVYEIVLGETWRDYESGIVEVESYRMIPIDEKDAK